MPQEKPKVLEKIQINGLPDIYKAVEPFLPSSNGLLRKSLVESYTSLRNKAKLLKSFTNIEDIDFGGIPPATAGFDINGYFFSLDNLITKYMGAKRDGLIIYWNLTEGRYTFDVDTGKIELCTNS